MISIRSHVILLILSIAIVNSLNAAHLKNSKHAKISKRELTNSNLDGLKLEGPANLKSNAAKDEANVKLEHGDALKATNQDTKSTKLEANIKLFKTEANLKDFNDPDCCISYCSSGIFPPGCPACSCS